MALVELTLSEDDVRQLLWEGLLSRGFKPAKHVRDVKLNLSVETRQQPVWEPAPGGSRQATDDEGNPLYETVHWASLKGGSVPLAVEPLDDRLIPPDYARNRR